MKATPKAIDQMRAALAAYAGESGEALRFLDSLEDKGLSYAKVCRAIANVSAKTNVKVNFSKELWKEIAETVAEHKLNQSNVERALTTHIMDINKDAGAYKSRSFSSVDVLAAIQKYVDLRMAMGIKKPVVVSTVMRAGQHVQIWSDGHNGPRDTAVI